MTKYKLSALVRYVSPQTGMRQWHIALEGVGVLGLSEKPEFKPGDIITISLEGPVSPEVQDA